MQTLSAETVEKHIPLIQKIARNVARTLPRHVSVDDLVGAGTIGLYDAALRFDDSRPGSFDRFAAYRIRGAMLDSLRGMDWLSRRDRARVKDGVLDDVGPRELDGALSETAGDAHATDASSLVDEREQLELLRSSLERLGQRQREVLALSFVDDMTLKEIADRFGVTESRVCQIRRSALSTLREFMDASTTC